MKRVVVTGARGFIGKNLCLRLATVPEIELVPFDIGDDEGAFWTALCMADVVFHLAGVNRPKDPKEFEEGNSLFTRQIVDRLLAASAKPVIVMTSSIQAELDNPYGVSKRSAEDALREFREQSQAKVVVFRLPNVYGKWSRPFYNSVVATFCHQIARGEAVRIDDPTKTIGFVYIDDVVDALLEYGLGGADNPESCISVGPVHTIGIGDLADQIRGFRELRRTGVLPDLCDDFVRSLYSTYLSYLDPEDFAYAAEKKADQRGYLFELIKSRAMGQIFVSSTLPGITRGNHYHHSKVEKFCVVSGKARIAFRHMVTQERVEYLVEGSECRIVDIPPGYTHSITNVGDSDLLTLFWANEPFDPQRPDTYFCEV